MSGIDKSVAITIQPGALQTLADSNYQMCFAKEVNGKYNVVWQSYGPEKYNASQDFTWTPAYQVFATNSYQAGVKVKVTSKPVNIGLGETCKINSAGIIQPPFTGGPETGFVVVNDWTTTNIGVNQLTNGIDGKPTSNPIYVSEDPIIPGSTTTLTPVERIQVWFQQDISTSTMISSSKSLVTTLDLTNSNTAAAEFGNDFKWGTPSNDNQLMSGRGAAPAAPFLILTLSVAGSVALADLLMKINSKLTGVLSGIEATGDLTQGQFRIVYSQRLGATHSDRKAIAMVNEGGFLSELLLQTANESMIMLKSNFKVLNAQAI